MVRGLKKFIVLFIMVIFSNYCYGGTVSVSDGIEAYKNGNYDSCITIMTNITKTDPTSVIGYYYLALAYTKKGNNSLALENYSRVINLNSDSTLTALARRGKSNIIPKKEVVVSPPEPSIEEAEEDYNPILNDSALNNKPTPQEEKEENKTKAVIKASDYAQKTNNNSPVYDPNREPTNDEIVNAIRILQKAGLLQNGAMNMNGGMTPAMPMDSRTQQMNSMMMMMNNGNNNNNMMQMMPYMNNGGKVDPQLMQMMLMQQMMPNFGNTNNNNGY